MSCQPDPMWMRLLIIDYLTLERGGQNTSPMFFLHQSETPHAVKLKLTALKDTILRHKCQVRQVHYLPGCVTMETKLLSYLAEFGSMEK